MNFFQKLFYSGPRCSKCGSILLPMPSGLHERLAIGRDKWATVMECARCGTLTCDNCTGFMSGMMTHPCNCGSTNFISHQMVRE